MMASLLNCDSEAKFVWEGSAREYRGGRLRYGASRLPGRCPKDANVSTSFGQFAICDQATTKRCGCEGDTQHTSSSTDNSALFLWNGPVELVLIRLGFLKQQCESRYEH